MSDLFRNSPEYQDWEESGGRDEDESESRQEYDRRERTEQAKRAYDEAEDREAMRKNEENQGR